MLFAAVTHIDEGQILETLLTLKVEKSVICLVLKQGATESIIEQQLFVFLKTLTRNEALACCILE
jgi:hypothetical protein